MVEGTILKEGYKMEFDEFKPTIGFDDDDDDGSDSDDDNGGDDDWD